LRVLKPYKLYKIIHILSTPLENVWISLVCPRDLAVIYMVNSLTGSTFRDI
jgi:hypothetical protein